MEYILKKLRQKTNMTQEAIADQLNVSINTLQNWERTDKISKESLHELLDVYKVNQATRDKTVLAIFGNDRSRPLEDDRKDNFPYFLFSDRPDVIQAAKNAILSPEEMDVFGYTYYMCHMINSQNDEYGHGPRKWPEDYSFYAAHGGFFRTRQMAGNIYRKIGAYANKRTGYDLKPIMAELVYTYGYSTSGKGFSFVNASKPEIAKYVSTLPCDNDIDDISGLYDMCACAVKPMVLGTEQRLRPYKNLPKQIRDPIELCWTRNNRYDLYHEKSGRDCIAEYLSMNPLYARCLTIERKEYSDEAYLRRKEQYISDRKAYNAHPNLYDKEPSFDAIYEIQLQLTDMGKKYLEWYTT